MLSDSPCRETFDECWQDVCDNGLKVMFDDKRATVTDKDGAQVCIFERKPGGLYLCKFRLKNPASGFAGRG